MNTNEYILIDRSTKKVGRYQFTYDDEDELIDAIDYGMLLDIGEMVTCVLNEFTQQDRDDLMALKRSELIQLHHSTGQDIRNAFGLWLEGNPNVDSHPDDTSMEVMDAMWLTLQGLRSGDESQVMEFE